MEGNDLRLMLSRENEELTDSLLDALKNKSVCWLITLPDRDIGIAGGWFIYSDREEDPDTCLH